MATAINLASTIPAIVSQVYQINEEAEENRFREYGSAVVIQSWFRATKVRRYFKFINSKAVTIQRLWRGYMDRERVRRILTETVYKMRIARYNEMATLVQKFWRGYYIRKYVFNYYSRKRYLAALQEKNAMIREELQEYEESMNHLEETKNKQSLMEFRIKWARDHHHLVSTHVQPGIFNSPFATRPMSQEDVLRSVKHPVMPVHKGSKKPCSGGAGHRFDPAWISYSVDGPCRLPPLKPHKPQGPFREPQEVRDQRYRPLNPSLRVMTDFYSVDKARQVMRDEEWTRRLHDDSFLPASEQMKPYDRTIVGTTEYGHIKYGTKYFREVDMEKHITTESFETLVPPIHVFDKFNKQYVDGYVEI